MYPVSPVEIPNCAILYRTKDNFRFAFFLDSAVWLAISEDSEDIMVFLVWCQD